MSASGIPDPYPLIGCVQHDCAECKRKDAELTAAQSRLREVEKNDARYRWLNKQDNFLCDLEMRDGQRRFRLKCGQPLDVWIDARIAEDAEMSGGKEG